MVEGGAPRRPGGRVFPREQQEALAHGHDQSQVAGARLVDCVQQTPCNKQQKIVKCFNKSDFGVIYSYTHTYLPTVTSLRVQVKSQIG